MHSKTPALLLVFLGAISLAKAADETSNANTPNTLIVPGKSIGEILLGTNAATDNAVKALGKDDGGRGGVDDAQEWYLGAHRGDKGRPFHRPDEIGIHTFTDTDKRSIVPVIVQIYTTSPRFHTADGIAPGSTLGAIRKKYPRIQPDDGSHNDNDDFPYAFPYYWPCHGRMSFYIDAGQGIVFSIRGSDGVCVEIDVVRPGARRVIHYPPLAAEDYVIKNFDLDGRTGSDIVLGMTDSKLLALLGNPGEKDETGYGSVWRWRLPAQGRHEPPGLNIFLWQLPDGTLIADQIELTSPAFVLDDTMIHPGSPLKDVLAGKSPGISKLAGPQIDETWKAPDVYGDSDLLFDIRNSVCTSISIVPPELVVHLDTNMRIDGGDKTHK